MPTYRQALEKLMGNPEKLKAWKKKYGEATLANFTKTSKRFSQKPIEVKSRGIETSKTKTPTATSLGVSTKKKTKEKNKTKVEIGTGASNVLEGSTGVGKKPTSKNERKTRRNVERLQKIAKRGKNKEARLNRRADRIAARKGFEGSGKFLTNPDGTVVPDNEGLMKARGKARELMAERKQKGKDFWRNFGSQMVRGTQAPPREGFKVKEGVAETAYGGKSGNPVEDEAAKESNKHSIDGKMGVDNDYSNKGMQNLLFKDYTNFAKDKVDNAFTSAKGFLDRDFSSPASKIEEEDSTPQTAMNKIYKQKRGY